MKTVQDIGRAKGDRAKRGSASSEQRIVQQTATKINGTVSQKIFYYVMNPANGGSITRISSRSILILKKGIGKFDFRFIFVSNLTHQEMGKMDLKSMEFYAYHGCYPEERKIGNRFMVDITIETDMIIPSESDHIDDALNYVQVYTMVKEEMDVVSHLLEHLCHRILNRIFTHFSQIQSIEVKVSKLNPPIGGQLESVSVTQQKYR